MRIKGLIRRLSQIEAKHGNVQVVTWEGDRQETLFMWYKSGAGYSLNYDGINADEKKIMIVKIGRED